MPLGISLRNVDKDSFLGLVRETIIYPPALTTNYFSSATDGGSAAAVSIAAAVVGDTINRSAAGKRPLLNARRVSVTQVDASGTTLTTTVRIKGRRFGVEFYEDITCGTGGGTVTGLSTRVYDEVLEVKIIAITANTTSDTLAIGFDATFVGLHKPFHKKEDIRLVMRNVDQTADSGGPKYSADITAAMVNLKDSAIDLNTLFGAAVTTTHIYQIEYESASGGVRETFRRKGLRFN